MKDRNRRPTKGLERIEYHEEGYKVCISNKLIDPEWDAFLQEIPYINPVQTSLWGQIKSYSGWSPIRIVIKENDSIIAGLQILARPVPFFGMIGYAPRAPVYQKEDDNLFTLLVDEIEKTAKKFRISALAIQMATENQSIEKLIRQRTHSSLSIEIAPTATIKLDLTQDQNILLSTMKRRNRRAIRKSLESDLMVREGTEKDLDDFYDLYKETSRRQEFIPFEKNYFSSLWKVLKPHDYIQLFVCEYEGELVSALLTTTFGKTIYTKSIGWSGHHSHLKPNHALYWAALMWAKSRMFKYCDLDGIDVEIARLITLGKSLSNEQMANPTFFKSGFGGEIYFYPETYIFKYSRLVRLGYNLYLSKLFPSRLINKFINIIRVLN